MQGLQLTGYGDPADVVKLVDLPDVGAPGPDEVVIDIEASPVEPTDLYIVAGVYGRLPPLPHLLGAQGAGRVSAAGRNVKYLKEGDRCLVPPLSSAWVNKVKAEASFLRPLPNGDVNQLSMLGINPLTAYLLLTEFRQLKAGDWIIQNGANSSVGRAVIPIAKARGIRTVSVVRRLELVDEMKALGGDVVLIDGLDLPQRIAAATDKAKIELALDSVGGLATQRLLDSIVLHGTVIVYSAMSGEPLSVGGPHLVFFSQRIQGFWVVNWLRSQTSFDKLTAIYDELAPMVAAGVISFPVAGEFGLNQYREALAVAGKFRGKAIFKPNYRK